MNKKLIVEVFYSAVIVAMTLTACLPGREAAIGGVRVWIDIPRDGSVLSLIPHQVIAHASDAAGVQAVVLIVNGTTIGAMSCENPTKPLSACSVMWNPLAPGDYRLEVRAANPSGASGLSAPVFVTIGKTAVTWEPEIDETDIPSEIPALSPPTTPSGDSLTPSSNPSTLTPTWTPPSPVCSGPPYIPFFTASPSMLTVGQSATLSWGAISNATSVAIDQGIGGVAAPGTKVVKPKETIIYTLTASGCGGTTTRQVTISVEPLPTTNTSAPPMPDIEGPTAPAIVMPTNNTVLPCSQDVKLVWTAPNDPSGIARYRVRLQVTSKVNPTDNDWEDVKIWDPLTGTHVGANDETTCGGYYRWRVVAYDGAGNQGKVSVWALFQIALP